jgi:hypothetical protein
MQSRGIRVTLVLPPVYPAAFDYFFRQGGYHEDWIRREAASRCIVVAGSFSPFAVHATRADFFDDVHTSPRLTRRLLAEAGVIPFYLTNRTSEQRVRFWLLISLPCVVVVAGIAFGVLGFIQKRDAPPQEFTPAQVAAKMLPDLNRPMDLNVNTEIELLEVRVARTEPIHLVGEVHNRTDRAIAHAEMVFDVTDARGSRLGAVSVPVDRIPPNITVPFPLPIEQRTAAFALVRELRTQ